MGTSSGKKLYAHKGATNLYLVSKFDEHLTKIDYIGPYLLFLVYVEWTIGTLTPKGPRPFFCQKTLKTAISIAKSKKIQKCFLCTFNRRILHLTSIKTCEFCFRIFDHTDCKISAFKVKKQVFQHIAGLDFLTLNIFNINFLHYSVLSFKSL